MKEIDNKIAQRYITNTDGDIKLLFNEKCACGNKELDISKDNPDYATCHSCLRVRRIMVMIVPDGLLTWWGIYFDPYLMEGLAGQFINAFIEHLPEDRYPRPQENHK